jgi:hypothetical protein
VTRAPSLTPLWGTPDEAEAEAAQDVADDNWKSQSMLSARRRPGTIRDLIVKARAASIDEFDGLRRSVIDDLLALDGGAGTA